MAESQPVPLPNELELRYIDLVVKLLITARKQIKAGNAMPATRAQVEALDKVMSHSATNRNDQQAISAFVTAEANKLGSDQASKKVGYTTVAQQFKNVKFSDVPWLGAQIFGLVKGVAATLDGETGPAGEDLGVQYNAATGQCLAIEIEDLWGKSGKTFKQIDDTIKSNLNFERFSDAEIGSNGARSRLEWFFKDGSMIAMDIPGDGVPEKYWVSMLPHVEKRPPPLNTSVHLTESGVVVPAGSHPAHIQFDWKEFSLKKYLESRGGQRPAYPGAGK